jgi:hypothetical protein
MKRCCVSATVEVCLYLYHSSRRSLLIIAQPYATPPPASHSDDALDDRVCAWVAEPWWPGPTVTARFANRPGPNPSRPYAERCLGTSQNAAGTQGLRSAFRLSLWRFSESHLWALRVPIFLWCPVRGPVSALIVKIMCVSRRRLVAASTACRKKFEWPDLRQFSKLVLVARQQTRQRLIGAPQHYDPGFMPSGLYRLPPIILLKNARLPRLGLGGSNSLARSNCFNWLPHHSTIPKIAVSQDRVGNLFG